MATPVTQYDLERLCRTLVAADLQLPTSKALCSLMRRVFSAQGLHRSPHQLAYALDLLMQLNPGQMERLIAALQILVARNREGASAPLADLVCALPPYANEQDTCAPMLDEPEPKSPTRLRVVKGGVR
jgi:hypothetical protein